MNLALVIAAAAAVQGEPTPSALADAALAAPEAAASGVIAYPPAFFAEARPDNAFDMLARLPGFAFSGGSELRGFAGSGGNVLIDGERPASKAVSLESLLKRIPADFVERIELVRGATPGFDMQGQSIVANVVRSRRAASSLATTVGGKLYPSGRPLPSLEAEWSRRSADLSLEAAASLDGEHDPGEGELTFHDAAGGLVSSGPYETVGRDRNLAASFAAELRRPANTMRFTLSYSDDTERVRDTQALSNAGGLFLGSDALARDFRSRGSEAGLEWTSDLSAASTLRVIALQTLERDRNLEEASGDSGLDTADDEEKAGESILRAVLTAAPSAALSFEGGGEVAYNFLEANATVTAGGAPVTLPNANVRVSEKRGEAFATAFWNPASALSIEAGSRFEFSTLRQRGDTNQSKSLFFPKPRLIATWRPDPSTQGRVRVEREVGQLDFADFTTSTEFSTGTVDAGGADLEPERAWVFEAMGERRFWAKGALVVTVRHKELQDVIDVLPVLGRFDAPGNIGRGTRDELDLVATLPLERVGLAGGLLTGELFWRRSKVTDPVTGARRRISEEVPFSGNLRFTQDIQRLKSTFTLEADLRNGNRVYRLNQVRHEIAELRLTVYWDWRPSPDLSLRVGVEQATGRRDTLARELYARARSAGIVRGTERQVVDYEPTLIVRLRKDW